MGLYNLKELDKVNNIQMDTPFGKPSSDFLTGEVNDIPVVFIPRHGTGTCPATNRNPRFVQISGV